MRFVWPKFAALLLVMTAAYVHGQVNPHTQIRWPTACANVNMVYSQFMNNCINVTGTAANPAGGTHQIQYNLTGAFAATAGFEFDPVANLFKAPAVLVTALSAGLCVHTDPSTGQIATTGADCNPTTVVKCGNSNDTAAINTALSGGGLVVLKGPCQLNPSGSGHMVIPSYTTLDTRGVQLTYSYSLADSMIQNTQASLNVQRSFADGATTAGSYILNSASLANFTSADQGQSVECDGAYGVGTFPGATVSTNFYTYIVSVTSSTAVVLADAPQVTFSSGSPTTCRLYYRDTNITILGEGGTWTRTGVSVSTCDAANFTPNMLFKTVNNLTIDGVTLIDGSTQASTNQGCKNIRISDASHAVVRKPRFNSWVTLQDGIDANGPLLDLQIDSWGGHTGDNGIAISNLGNPQQGTVRGVRITGMAGATGFGMIRLFGPLGNPMWIRDVYIKDEQATNEPTPSTYKVGSGSCLELYWGYMDNINLDGCNGWLLTSDVQLGTINVGSAVLKNLGNNMPAISTAVQAPMVALTSSATAVFDNLTIGGMFVDSGERKAYYLHLGDTSSDSFTAHNFTIQDSKFYGINGYSGQNIIFPIWMSNVTVDTLSLVNNLFNYNVTTTAQNQTINIRGGSIGRITTSGNKVEHQSGSLSAGEFMAFNNLGGVNPTVGSWQSSNDSYNSPTSLSGTYWAALNGFAGTAPPITVSNLFVNGITGCFFGTVPAGSQFVNIAANVSGSGTCTPNSPVAFPFLLPSFILPNQTATISPTTVFTATAAGQQVTGICTIQTGSTTGSGNAQFQWSWSGTYNPGVWFPGSAGMALTSGNVASFTVNAPLGAVGNTLQYRVNYTSTGSYTLSCGHFQVQ